MSDRDHYILNILERIDTLEREVARLQRVAEAGLVKADEVYIPGQVHFDLPSKDLRLLNAFTSGVTDDGAIQVSYDGWTQYIRTFTTP